MTLFFLLYFVRLDDVNFCSGRLFSFGYIKCGGFKDISSLKRVAAWWIYTLIDREKIFTFKTVYQVWQVHYASELSSCFLQL